MKNKNRLKLIGYLIILAFFNFNCGNDEEQTVTPPAASKDDISPVFSGEINSFAGDNSSILVKWEPAFDETTSFLLIEYEIFVSDDAGYIDLQTPTAIKSGSFTYTANGLNSDTLYMVLIRAKDEAGNYSNFQSTSAVTFGLPDTTAPVFTGLSSAENLSALSGTEIFITWQPATDDISASENISYHVYISETSGGQNFNEPVHITEPGVTQASIEQLNSYTKYFFVVRAADIAGNIDTNTSEFFIFTLDETKPVFTGLRKAMPIGPDQITLTWYPATDNKDNSSDIIYEIFQSTTSNAFDFDTPSYTTAAGETTYTITGLTTNVTYFYIVRAVDTSGNKELNTVQKFGTPKDTGTIEVNVTVDGVKNTPFNMPADIKISGLAEYDIQTNRSVHISADGTNWSSQSLEISDTIFDMIFDGTNYYAIGYKGVIYESSDGTNWSSIDSGKKVNFKRILFNGTKYIIIGNYGTILGSTDANTWASETSNTINILNDIIWDGAKFIAVGNAGIILKSSGAGTWSKTTVGTENFNSIYFDGTSYFIGGSNGTLLKSADSITWNPVTINPATENINSISYNVATPMHIAVGDNGLIMQSTDGGDNWAIVTSGTSENINDIIFNDTNSLFIAAGNHGLVLNSADGTSWSTITPFADEQYTGILWESGNFYLYGYTGQTAFQTAVEGTYTAECRDYVGYTVINPATFSVTAMQTKNIACQYTSAILFIESFEDDNSLAGMTTFQNGSGVPVFFISSFLGEYGTNSSLELNFNGMPYGNSGINYPISNLSPSSISFHYGVHGGHNAYFIISNDTNNILKLTCPFGSFFVINDNDSLRKKTIDIQCQLMKNHFIEITEINYSQSTYNLHIDDTYVGTYLFDSYFNDPPIPITNINNITLGSTFGEETPIYMDEIVFE